MAKCAVVHQTSGKQLNGLTGWVTAEPARYKAKWMAKTPTRLITPWKYAPRYFHGGNVWQDVIQLFCHWFMIQHDGQALITRLDCADNRIITVLTLESWIVDGKSSNPDVGEPGQEGSRYSQDLLLSMCSIDTPAFKSAVGLFKQSDML